MKTRSTYKKTSLFKLQSEIEPAIIDDALSNDEWIMAMQEELDQVKINDVWDLVPKPKEKEPIGTKWVSRNQVK